MHIFNIKPSKKRYDTQQKREPKKRGWRIWAQPKMTEKQNKKLKNNK